MLDSPCRTVFQHRGHNGLSMGQQPLVGVPHDEGVRDGLHHLDVVLAVAESVAFFHRNADVFECMKDARALRFVRGIQLKVSAMCRIYKTRDARKLQKVCKGRALCSIKLHLVGHNIAPGKIAAKESQAARRSS